MILLLSLLDAAPVPALPPTECEQAVTRLIQSADAETRVVATFTGSQSALLPLDEALDPQVEPTLFPVGTDKFVLTVQFRSGLAPSANIVAFVGTMCAVGVTAGARFNGVMAFKRETTISGGKKLTQERMIDATFAKLTGK